MMILKMFSNEKKCNLPLAVPHNFEFIEFVLLSSSNIEDVEVSDDVLLIDSYPLILR